MNNLGVWANWAQIISLFVAIVAIVVAVVSLRRGRQRRALSCIFDPIVAPIKIESGDALRGQIEIRYMGKPVENLSLVQAKLKNTGNLPIRKEHVIEPVTFTFGPDSELLRPPVVLQKNPANLSLEWTVIAGTTSKPNSVSLTFDLLNPRDELTVQFICTGASVAPEVKARIEGVSEIELFDAPDKYSLMNARRVMLIAVMFAAMLVLLLFLSPSVALLPLILVVAVSTIAIELLKYLLKK